MSDHAGQDPWVAGTFEGLRLAQLHDVARLSPAERLEWLDAALDVAMRSGALDRDRQERRRAAEAWSR